MTPKQKATRLFTIMWGALQNGMPHEEAKRCSLIAVNEILDDYEAFPYKAQAGKEYWQEVKTEIEKI